MDAVWVAVGLVLILAGIWDLFMTVLYYDAAGPLSLRLYKLVWSVLRRIANRVPETSAAFTLSFGVPLMVLASLALWISLQVVGFAFIYYVGLHQGAFRFSEGLDASAVEALYLSSISVSGLGYGDLAPVTAPFQLAAGLQALTGYGFLTIAIAYVVNVYKVIEDMSILSADIYHESEHTYDSRHILEVHFHLGRPTELTGRLSNFYSSMISHHEGMRHYPVVYYFYSRRGYAALPYRFGLIGKVIAALRWGVPSDDPISEEPWLRALKSAYESISDEILERFLEIDSWRPADQPLDAVSFARDLAAGRSHDAMMARFLEMLKLMDELTECEQPRDPDEAYARYLEWLPFMSRVDAFLESMIQHLSPRS
ncbi:MAG TPA: potassium channel family protein [Actinomycetota bacterium]|nr:potassium channel family protein [Actinomycetota bacterium]